MQNIDELEVHLRLDPAQEATNRTQAAVTVKYMTQLKEIYVNIRTPLDCLPIMTAVVIPGVSLLEVRLIRFIQLFIYLFIRFGFVLATRSTTLVFVLWLS